MSKTLRHFIREALMDVSIGSYRFKIDAMQIGDAEYNATIAKYPASKLIFMNIEQAFERARQNRVSYLTSDFEARLDKLLEHHKITGINKEKIRDAMLLAVSSAKLYVQRYPDDVMTLLEPFDRGWIFNPSTKSWGKIAASTSRYSKLSIGAFVDDGNVFCPPPKLFFNSAKELTVATIPFESDNVVDLFEHELEHVETEAVVKLGATDIVNPAVLSYDIVLNMLVPPEEVTFDKMQTFVDDIPALLLTVSDDEDTNTIASCVYLAILAYSITRGKNQKYFDNAVDIASANKLKQDHWDQAQSNAIDHSSPDHLRTSMIFLQDALPGALMNQTDKFQIMKDVEKFMKAQKRNKDQIRRSLSLLAITDVSKYNNLMLVASVDTPTTRNQA